MSGQRQVGFILKNGLPNRVKPFENDTQAVHHISNISPLAGHKLPLFRRDAGGLNAPHPAFPI